MTLHQINGMVLDTVSSVALVLFAIEAIARLGIMTGAAIKRAWKGTE